MTKPPPKAGDGPPTRANSQPRDERQPFKATNPTTGDQSLQGKLSSKFREILKAYIWSFTSLISTKQLYSTGLPAQAERGHMRII